MSTLLLHLTLLSIISGLLLKPIYQNQLFCGVPSYCQGIQQEFSTINGFFNGTFMLGIISTGKGLLSLFKATIAQLIIIRREKSLTDINIYALCCPIYCLNSRGREADNRT